MQRHFDEELIKLNNCLIEMGAMAEQSIYLSVDALKKQDKVLAKEVIEKDKKIDELELSIDEQIVALLALRQPLAVDLRFLVMASKINSEIERIADLAVNIAQRAIFLSDQPMLKQLEDIPALSELARKMFREALDAFVKRDVELARNVILEDPQANLYRNKIYADLMEYMVKNGADAPRAVPLLLVSRFLERICDHASYIAENVIYMVQAKVIKHHRKELF